jgi:hypothetical protein
LRLWAWYYRARRGDEKNNFTCFGPGFHPVSTLRTWGKHLGNGGVVDKKMSIPGLKHQHRTVPPPKAAPAVAPDQPAAADDLRLGDSNSRLAAAKLGSRAPSLSLGGLG